ncbi:MAG: helicase [Firmicutes bacterium]|nr:helicase [Bacillota bacterium]
MISITRSDIINVAHSFETFARGVMYHDNHRVKDVIVDQRNLCVSAIVQGSENYGVTVSFSATGGIGTFSCDCPADSIYAGACKHTVALLIACQHISDGTLTKAFEYSNNHVVGNIVDYYDNFLSRPQKKTLNLEINLEVYDYSWNRGKGDRLVCYLFLRMGEDKLYVVQNVKRLLEAINSGENLYFGKNFEFDPNMHTFKPEDKSVLDLLNELYEVEKNINKNSWGYENQSAFFSSKKVLLPQTVAKRMFNALHNRDFNIWVMNGVYVSNAGIVEKDLPLNFSVDVEKDNLLLKWNNNMFPLLDSIEYFLYDGKVYHISEQQRELLMPLVNAYNDSNGGIRITDQHKEQTFTHVIPSLKQIGEVEIAPAVQESLCRAELKTEIYLDKVDDGVTAKVEFLYDDIRINPFSGQTPVKVKDKILVRDVKGEREVYDLLEAADFHTLTGTLYLEEEDKIYDFVFSILPKMQKIAAVYYSNNFRRMMIREKTSLTGKVSLNEGNDMLEITFGSDDINPDEIADIFHSLREKKKYHRLKDGSFLPLDSPDKQLHQVVDALDALNVSERELNQGVLSLPKYRAIYLDNCLKESRLQTERDTAFKQLVQNITQPQDMEFEVPVDIDATLRSYQETGFKWLKTLATYGLGGVLADDMGLGKTIQTLTFIMSEKDKAKGPAMVVAPTSVVYNWQEEAQKFTPNLNVTVIIGSPQERKKLIQEAKEVDLIITSYSLIRRDVEKYNDIKFSYCFLDEAQNIKNPKSLSAKAVKKINAQGYFALTGTPLENSLTELWSIFDFIMPGYLLSHKKFVEKYERPIIVNQNEEALNKMQKLISPFILRRMKKDVLKELPPKFEHKVLTDLTKEQKKIYLAYLKQAKGEIEQEIADNGFGKSQIKILSILTRLRQICCHPATFVENYDKDSGKLEYLKEFLQDAIKGGHRVLLFSQFTSMLKIIASLLEEQQISYCYLDGSTKTVERRQLVKSFNNGENDVFLLSLKAGGTGLNLTSADMVIHFDPWWNPAVEEQAADRAYRIGQKNSVQVISLVTKGTIEEKIYHLQQKKKDMINSVIKPGETMLSKMTEQEMRELFDVR